MNSDDTPDLTTGTLAALAGELGLDAFGVCRARHYSDAQKVIEDRLGRGLFADLKFTMTRADVSCHPESILPGAKSVISVAFGYLTVETGHAVEARHVVGASDAFGVIARYTRIDAYASLILKLEELASLLRASGKKARVLVDSNDHVDREAARLSGVGFAGKNTNVITRTAGSYVVLGTLVTDALLEPTPPMRQGCGSCTLCIDACPTDAISRSGWELDVRNCITYWTQSRHVIPDSITAKMNNMVYGCDICQEVCPWNRGPVKRASGRELDGRVLLSEWLQTPSDILRERYRRFFIPRGDVRYLRRNAIVALGNVGTVEDLPLLAAYLERGSGMLYDHAVRASRMIEEKNAGRPL